MNTASMTLTQGICLVLGYGAAAFLLSWFVSRNKSNDKQYFLLADRKLGTFESAFSIAASWIWAPALFLSAQKAYTNGFAGVFWFTVPNVLCLILFAHFAHKVRDMFPEGFTLSDYMRSKYSKRVQGLYLVQLSALAACSFAVQLLAGGKVLSSLTGISFGSITIILAIIALSYSMMSGLKASVVTDYLQMVIILLVTLTVVPWAVIKAGGIQAVTSGIGGHTGTFGNLFKGDGLKTAWIFGIPVTIGLMAGPFGDQSFWQRAFATKKPDVRKAFIWGALIFAVVPITLSLLGFIAAGKGWTQSDPALVNLNVVARLLPQWIIMPVVFMLLSGLISTLDSNLCAFSSLAGHDYLGEKAVNSEEEANDRDIVRVSRWGMLILALAGVAIANIPSLKILYLFLFYGSLRASTFLPTVLTLSTKWVSEKGMFYGILVAIIIGLPVSAYGNLTHNNIFVVMGAILTAGISGSAIIFMKSSNPQ